MNSKIYDILIIGAGPSGSAAAITLAKQGHSVLLIDQFSFPREKICGDGLTGDSPNMLKKLGVWEKIESIAYKSSKVELFTNNNRSFNLEAPVYTVKREKLDMILLDSAISYGVEFRQRKFLGKVLDKTNFSTFETNDVNLNIDNINAKFCLFATGCQYSKALKSYNLVRPDLIAVRGYYKADCNIKHPLVFLDNDSKNGYYWIFPMGNKEYNIGYGTHSYQKIDLKKKLNQFIAKKMLSEDFSGYWLTPIKGAFLRTGLSNFDKSTINNILFTGEVLGSTFPFTGEGIGKAMETGIIAAEVVHKTLVNNDISVLNEYKNNLKNNLQIRYRPYRIASFISKYALFNKFFFKLLANSTKLCYITSQILNDKVGSDRLSFKGIIKAIFRITFSHK